MHPRIPSKTPAEAPPGTQGAPPGSTLSAEPQSGVSPSPAACDGPLQPTVPSSSTLRPGTGCPFMLFPLEARGPFSVVSPTARRKRDGGDRCIKIKERRKQDVSVSGGGRVIGTPSFVSLPWDSQQLRTGTRAQGCDRGRILGERQFWKKFLEEGWDLHDDGWDGWPRGREGAQGLESGEQALSGQGWQAVLPSACTHGPWGGWASQHVT